MKKNNRENGPALVGLEIRGAKDLELLKNNLMKSGFQFEYLNKNDNLLQFLM
jgi:threonine dehydratase